MACVPFKCDRCKRDIKNTPDDLVYRYKTSDAVYDFCPECQAAFIEFVMCGEKLGDTNE